MSGVHGIDVRFRYLLIHLHQLLTIVLEFAIDNHIDDCKKTTDFNKRLAKIIFKSSNKTKFEKKKVLTSEPYRRHFYDVGNIEKTEILIKDLDVTVLVTLITTPFMKKSLYTKCQCCGNCKHEKCMCGNEYLDTKICPDKSNCKYQLCPDCVKVNPSMKSCDYLILLKFAKICKSFRGSISHLPNEFFPTFEIGTTVLNDFPNSKKMEGIWEVINTASKDCLRVLWENSFIDDEKVDDFKMYFRSALKMEVISLVTVVERSVDHYYKVILGEADCAGRIDEFKDAMITSMIEFIKGKRASIFPNMVFFINFCYI